MSCDVTMHSSRLITGVKRGNDSWSMIEYFKLLCQFNKWDGWNLDSTILQLQNVNHVVANFTPFPFGQVTEEMSDSSFGTASEDR